MIHVVTWNKKFEVRKEKSLNFTYRVLLNMRSA